MRSCRTSAARPIRCCPGSRNCRSAGAIYKSLRDTGRVITDPEIQEYIQDIGQKLAAHATDNGQKFRFFVVDDPAINAFALPGGFVGVHSGLILATANESELAGRAGSRNLARHAATYFARHIRQSAREHPDDGGNAGRHPVGRRDGLR